MTTRIDESRKAQLRQINRKKKGLASGGQVKRQGKKEGKKKGIDC